MKNKYYTPELEDLFIGYECEKGVLDFSCTGCRPKDWEPYKIGQDVDFEKGPREISSFLFWGVNLLRTPYLTKEQIEGEGWRVFERNGFNDGRICYEKGNYFLTYHEDPTTKLEGRIEILVKDIVPDRYTEWTSNGRLYLGKCPSINEFRKICKLLNI